MDSATQLAASAAVSPGWKWLAVLIGIAVLALLYVVTAVTSGKWDPRQLFQGADGRPSTSKFQWLLWIVVIVFAYTALWVLRAKQGDYAAISQVPVNLLTVLGFSTGTAAAAKGITSGYVQTSRVAKSNVSAGGVLSDDSGVPELAKIQVMGFTLIATGIFLATLIHQIVSNPVITSLPNLDSSLLVLMGISSGGYLGKKLVTFSPPALYATIPPTAQVGTTVTVTGASLGPAPGGALQLNDTPIPFTSWSTSAIEFTVPAADPTGAGGQWPPANPVQLVAALRGQTSNSVDLAVTQ
jgi:hypothetical protein